jgi:phosphatidylglycerophosphate synthase
MWAGWFRLKPFAEDTQEEDTASPGTGAANLPGKRPADPTTGIASPAAGHNGPGPATARRAVADAGTAVGAYLVAWAWLGTAVHTDPVPWLLALTAGAAVIMRATGSVLRRKPRFSTPADRVTLGRAGIVACCAAETVVGLIAGAGPSPPVVALGTAAFLLDAVDGRVARFTGSATAEGSHLDSDTDAALVLVLSFAAAGRYGLWPLGIGLMYYAFLAAARFRPSLKNPLPPSTVRRVIGATQPAALLFALFPGMPPPLGAMVLGPALGLLAFSFGRDVVGLERLRASRALAAGSPTSRAGTPAGT